jgi:hypothetical protein
MCKFTLHSVAAASAVAVLVGLGCRSANPTHSAPQSNASTHPDNSPAESRSRGSRSSETTAQPNADTNRGTPPPETVVATPAIASRGPCTVLGLGDAVGKSLIQGKITDVKLVEHPAKVNLAQQASISKAYANAVLNFIFVEAEVTFNVDAYVGELPPDHYVPQVLKSMVSDFQCPLIVDPKSGAQTPATAKDEVEGGWHLRRCHWQVTGYDVTLEYPALNPALVVGQEYYFHAGLPDATDVVSPTAGSATLFAVANDKVWFQQVCASKGKDASGLEAWGSIAPFAMDLATFKAEVAKLLGASKPAPSAKPAAKTTPPK